MSKSSKSNAPTAQPTAMATIAAVDSFLDFLWTGGAGGFSDGDGAGDGKNGLHGGKGPPQRSRFPLKEDAGNFDKVSGIDPLRLLFDTLKSTKPAEMLGRVPEKPLFSKNSPVK